MIWLIAPDGRRVTATEEDAVGMVEHCGYSYVEPPPPPPEKPITSSFVADPNKAPKPEE